MGIPKIFPIGAGDADAFVLGLAAFGFRISLFDFWCLDMWDFLAG